MKPTILTFGNYKPRIAADVFIAHPAAVLGDGEIGEGSGGLAPLPLVELVRVGIVQRGLGIAARRDIHPRGDQHDSGGQSHPLGAHL